MRQFKLIILVRRRISWIWRRASPPHDAEHATTVMQPRNRTAPVLVSICIAAAAAALVYRSRFAHAVNEPPAAASAKAARAPKWMSPKVRPPRVDAPQTAMIAKLGRPANELPAATWIANGGPEPPLAERIRPSSSSFPSMTLMRNNSNRTAPGGACTREAAKHCPGIKAWRRCLVDSLEHVNPQCARLLRAYNTGRDAPAVNRFVTGLVKDMGRKKRNGPCDKAITVMVNKWKPLDREALRSRARMIARGMTAEGEISIGLSKGLGQIPRIIHQFSRLPSGLVAAKHLLTLESRIVSLHPNWCVIYWDQNEVQDLIKEKFKDTIAPVYRQYDSAVFREDIARYALIATFGGFFLETDMQCHASLETIRAKASLVLSRTAPNPRYNRSETKFQPLVTSAVIGSTPGHPFWDLAFDELQHVPPAPPGVAWATADANMITGSGLMQRAFSRMQPYTTALNVLIAGQRWLSAYPPLTGTNASTTNSSKLDDTCNHEYLLPRATLGLLADNDSKGINRTSGSYPFTASTRRQWLCSGGSLSPFCRQFSRKPPKPPRSVPVEHHEAR